MKKLKFILEFYIFTLFYTLITYSFANAQQLSNTLIIQPATSTIATYSLPEKITKQGLSDHKFISPNQKLNDSSITSQPSCNYIKDNDTEILERAITIYNTQLCPPNEPIREINNQILSRLKNHELLPNAYEVNISNIVFIDGKVYKKAYNQNHSNDIFSSSTHKDSLFETLSAVVKAPTTEYSPGHGNPLSRNTSTTYDEKILSYRNNSGEIIEKKYWLPKIREQNYILIQGQKQSPQFTDIIRSRILPTIFRRIFTKPYPIRPDKPQTAYNSSISSYTNNINNQFPKYKPIINNAVTPSESLYDALNQSSNVPNISNSSIITNQAITTNSR